MIYHRKYKRSPNKHIQHKRLRLLEAKKKRIWGSRLSHIPVFLCKEHSFVGFLCPNYLGKLVEKILNLRCFGYFLGRFYHLYLILYPPFKGNFLTFAVRTGQPEGFFYPTSAVEILKNRQSKRSLPSVKPACLSRRTHMLRRWGHQHPKHGTRKKNWHLLFFFLRDPKNTPKVTMKLA